MNLIEHTLLTPDFWQDNVTYEGKSMPTGTLVCAALNLSDEVIAKLSQLCMPLNLYMEALQLGQADTAQMEMARESAFQIVELLRNEPPFSCLEYEIVCSYVDAVFTEDYLQNTKDFAKSGNLTGVVFVGIPKDARLAADIACHGTFGVLPGRVQAGTSAVCGEAA